MPLQSALVNRKKGLCLLSLDAGGAQGISQLKILADLMHRLNFEAQDDSSDRPCAVFDMIGGTGSGGFIAILLVLFGLTSEQALEEFIDLAVNVLRMQGATAPARTTVLKDHIASLMKRNGIAESTRIQDSNDRAKGCKLVIPISYKSHVGSKSTLRNYNVRQEPAVNLTIAEALLATLATPPLFTSVSISKDAATFDYIAGDLTLSNPTREIISEAYRAFGAEAHIALLLSIGNGQSGVVATPEDVNLASYSQFLERLVTDSEQTAEEIESQMGHLGIYHRFNVTRGLEKSVLKGALVPGEVLEHTAVYLGGTSVSRRIDLCINSLKIRDGIVSLEQLQHSGGQSLSPLPVPAPLKTFVMRKEPWEFLENAVFNSDDTDEDRAQRMVVLTGIGGCGKTQLALKFMDVYKSRFISRFVVDGSSEPRIRADILHHVRSLGIVHSQKSFDECLLFLSQPSADGPRFILYDNVDDPELDLLPLIPEGDGCIIFITTRNRSLGELSPDSHLELDVMSMQEGVEMLLFTPNNSNMPTEDAKKGAAAIAEALGCLPIALQQARSYMFQTKASPSAYLQRLATNRNKLLAQPLKNQRNLRYLSAYAAFEASFSKLSSRDQKFLWLLSFFHWSRFPLALVTLAANYGFSEYFRTCVMHGNEFTVGNAFLKELFFVEEEWSITNLDEMTITLQNYSLATLIPAGEMLLLQLHPLVHEWVHSNIPEEDYHKYRSGAILLLALGDRAEYTPSSRYLTNHIIHLRLVWDQLPLNDVAAFASILGTEGLFQDAAQLQEKVVAGLIQRGSPPSDPALVDSRFMLASIYWNLGRIMEAKELQESILQIKKSTLGENHLDTIAVAGDLALTYSKLGRLNDALVLEEEVVRRKKELLGERHPRTIDASSNLAASYSDAGQILRAEALQVEILRLRREILGQKHPSTLDAMNNLATTVVALGRWEEGERLQAEVWTLRKELLGERHPRTIDVSTNLAATYTLTGRYQEAETILLEALRLRKEIQGEKHPDTIKNSTYLALAYKKLGWLNEAAVLEADALRLQKELVGERHPDTINTANNLAHTYDSLGRLDEARNLLEDVSKLQKEVMGERHPRTLSAYNNLASIYRELGRYDEARMLQERVLQLRKEVLGSRHPNTLGTANNLAITYRYVGRLDEAESLQVETLGQLREVLGDRHPDTANAMLTLVEIYESLHKKTEAMDLLTAAQVIISERLGTTHPLYRESQDIKSRVENLQ